MRCTTKSFLLFATLLSFCSPLHAETAPSLPELVEQLGADSFELREQASLALIEMGSRATKALQQGLESQDQEVTRRCQRLLDRLGRSKMEIALDAYLTEGDQKHLFEVPAWERFSKIVGDNKTTRMLFVHMCCMEGSLISLAEKNPSQAASQLEAHCQALQQSVRGNARLGGFPTTQAGITTGQVAALLFLTSDKRIKAPRTALYAVVSFLSYPGPKATFESNASARKLLVKFIEKNNDPTMVHQCMSLIQRFKLEEAVDLVLNIAQDKKQSGYVRANALVTLGKMEHKEHVKKLEPMLTDTTQVTQIRWNDLQIQVQLRDVALAMMIVLSGDNLLDYPYPYFKRIQVGLRANPQIYMYSYSYLGFSDDKQRQAARKLFEERRTAAVKKAK